MAGAPKIKVFNAKGEYIAACKFYEDAACLVNLYGNGATVRIDHSTRGIVWTQDEDIANAGESYDEAAERMRANERNLLRELAGDPSIYAPGVYDATIKSSVEG
jgi:hypothetical protein